MTLEQYFVRAQLCLSFKHLKVPNLLNSFVKSFKFVKNKDMSISIERWVSCKIVDIKVNRGLSASSCES